jgi:drug/metabolite transporter (DMT)-like permease
MTNSKLKLISYVTLVASISFSIAGQLLMKHAVSNKIDGVFTSSFLQQLVLAITVYSLGVVNWVVALRFIKLSIAYPLTSLNYVGILFGSYYFFHEQITLIRVVGVALIFIGVLFVVIPVKNRSIQKRAS